MARIAGGCWPPESFEKVYNGVFPNDYFFRLCLGRNEDEVLH